MKLRRDEVILWWYLKLPLERLVYVAIIFYQVLYLKMNHIGMGFLKLIKIIGRGGGESTEN